MGIVQLGLQLHLIKPAFGQVSGWQDGPRISMIDTGVPGCAGDLADAPVVLGERATAAPDLTAAERPLHQRVAAEALVRLTQLPADTVCVGHGDPLADGADAWAELGARCRDDVRFVPDPLA